MIQNYNSLKQAVDKFNSKTPAYGQVQKIYSTRTTLCISLRYPGITRFLYLGRGGGVEGLWEGLAFPPSGLRCRDRLLEYFRRHFTSSLVARIDLDLQDRILILPYTKYNKTHYFMYFWSGRKSFLLHAFYPDLNSALKVFTSWKGDILMRESTTLKEELLELFEDVGRIDIGKDTGISKEGEIKEILDKEEAATGREKLISKKEKSLKKKLKFIHDDLSRVREYEAMKAFAKKEEVSLENKDELTLGSHHFKLRSLTGHHQKMNLVFEKIKKLQKAEKILELRQSSTEDELSKVSTLIPEEVELKNLPGPRFEVKKEKKELIAKKDWWEFKINDKSFAIGKSAQGNDELRSSYASKEDWWIHLDQKESAHLILKADWHKLAADEIQILASALAEHSKIDLKAHSLIPILYTQVKYLKGVKGKAGLVLYKKEKRMALLPLENWKNFISPLFAH